MMNISKSNQKKVKNIFNHLKWLHEIRDRRFDLSMIQVAICFIIILLAMLWNRLQPQSPIPDIVVFLVCITAFGIGHIIKNVALRRNLQRVIINHGIPLDKENIKHLGFSYIISATAKNGSKHFSFNHVYGEVLEMSLIRSADMKEGCLTLFDPQSKFREPLENTLRDNGYHVPARTGKFHETETIEATGTGGENEKAEGRPRS